MVRTSKRPIWWRLVLLAGVALLAGGVVWSIFIPGRLGEGLTLAQLGRVLRDSALAATMRNVGMLTALAGVALHPGVRRWALGLVRAGAAAGAAGVRDGMGETVPDRLVRLDDLRTDGLVTAEEHAKKRRAILDEA